MYISDENTIVFSFKDFFSQPNHGLKVNLLGRPKLFQIEFLCNMLSLGDSAFGALASTPGIAMYISEAIVFSYKRFFSKLNLGLESNLLDRLRLNTDPERFRWVDILTSPTTVCRHIENMAWQLVFDAAENILLPCAQETVSRTRDTAAKTILYFMFLSRPLVKVALLLRASILLSEIVESHVITLWHAEMLKCLMRDVHREFPTDAHKKVIRPLLTIFMEIECILAKNKSKPITVKGQVFPTAKKGARIIVRWTKNFMAIVASATIVESPPTVA